MMVYSPILALIALAFLFVRDPGIDHPSVQAKADAKAASAFPLHTLSDVSDASELQLHGGRVVAPSQLDDHKHANTSVVKSASGASPGSSSPAIWLAGQVHVDDTSPSIHNKEMESHLRVAALAAASLGKGEPSPVGDANVERRLRMLEPSRTPDGANQEKESYLLAAELAKDSLGKGEPSPVGDANAELHLQLRDTSSLDRQTVRSAFATHLRGTTAPPHRFRNLLNILLVPKLLDLVTFVALLLMVP